MYAARDNGCRIAVQFYGKDIMTQKEIIIPITSKETNTVSAKELAVRCGNSGADAILFFDLSDKDAEHDRSIAAIKELARAVDIPIYGGGNIRRMEDVKKLLYAGCRKVFLNYAKEENIELTHEVSSRFGREKILACVKTEAEMEEAKSHGPLLGGIVSLAGTAFVKTAAEEELPELVAVLTDPFSGCAAMQAKEDVQAAVQAALSLPNVSGVCADWFTAAEFDFMELKHWLKDAGIAVNTFEVSVTWDIFIPNSDGLVPVVVQDYKTEEVLMVAYMNEEAFFQTIRTGRMTYWSRSRQELWIKGLTSGHFQYLKELRLDCDNDTLLAKVHQIGAACHTGNRSCFYRTLLKKEYDETNPLKVFEEVYDVIQDRKVHPKEGSYTNYLFDKGIDKILKKVGEEATEIVIAAKNPDPEEVKYEISDFLYHVMVLMAEKGVTWEDITKELARR